MASGSTVFEFGSNDLIKAVRGLGGHRIIFGAGGASDAGFKVQGSGQALPKTRRSLEGKSCARVLQKEI